MNIAEIRETFDYLAEGSNQNQMLCGVIKEYLDTIIAKGMAKEMSVFPMLDDDTLHNAIFSYLDKTLTDAEEGRKEEASKRLRIGIQNLFKIYG